MARTHIDNAVLPKILRGILLHVDSRIRIAGPGDALRFVHALRLLHARKRFGRIRILVHPAELSRLNGLFTARGVMLSKLGAAVDGPITWLCDKNALAQVPSRPAGTLYGYAALDPLLGSARLPSTSPTVHAHLGRGLTPRSAVGYLNTRKHRIQIDDSAFLLRERIYIPGLSLRKSYGLCHRPARLAVVVRRHPTTGEIATPSWFIDAMAAASGVYRTWFGVATASGFPDVPTEDEIAPYGALSYVHQVHEFAKFDAAVGFNSGGLDLAAAAGIPILRVAEHQALGRRHRDGNRSTPWGSCYNSFLARATNVGLSDADNSVLMRIFPASLLQWLVALRLGRLAAPSHIVLDENVPFNLDALKVGAPGVLFHHAS